MAKPGFILKWLFVISFYSSQFLTAVPMGEYKDVERVSKKKEQSKTESKKVDTIIVNEALKQLTTKKYSYRNKTTHWGKLACAAFISGVLKDAGIINRVSVNTKGLTKILVKDGWVEIPLEKVRPGDVVFWGRNPGGTHGHVGIVYEKSGGSWYTIDNDSSVRYPRVRPLYRGKRPIEKVFRSPKTKI
ncbi:CHAP domain-containing protein [Candidatus Riflebacteria bacterium]